MAKREQPDPPGAPAAEEKPAEAPRRAGPDAFQDAPGKKPAFSMKPDRSDLGTGPMPRKRVLDPRLVPLVPPSVTTDPARQFHALLGLPRQGPKAVLPPPVTEAPRAEHPKPEPKPRKVVAPVREPEPPPRPVKEAPPQIEKILQTLPGARATIIRQVITGPESRLKRALRAFLEDSKFQALDFDSQRRALAAFDLRS